MSHDPVLPDLGQLPADYFVGQQHITDGVLARLLSQRDNFVRKRHVPITGASTSSTAPGQQPSIVVSNSLILFGFTLNTDDLYSRFKIPPNYAGDPAVHVHWSKTTDADELGNVVRWRLRYTVFDGSSQVANGVPTSVEVEDAYSVSDTTDRVVHRSADVPLVGIVAGSYLTLQLDAITPVGTPLAAEPGAFSLDLTFDELINR